MSDRQATSEGATAGVGSETHMDPNHGVGRQGCQGRNYGGYSRIRDVILDEWRRVDHTLDRDLLMEILRDTAMPQVRYK